MEVPRFLELVEHLTGTSAKILNENENQCLARILRDDGHKLDCTQMNELLLLVNKDRLETPFYDHFFGRGCKIADLTKGVENFQKAAMLCYGNFVYAYRTLSRFKDDTELKKELRPILRQPKDIVKDFRNRSQKLLEIDPIEKERTFLVGYLSAQDRAEDLAYANMLMAILEIVLREPEANWENLGQKIDATREQRKKTKLHGLAERYHKRYGQAKTLQEFHAYLKEIAIPAIDAMMQQLRDTQGQAARNQDVYLTWDHMDVYFATSMRKRWEYEDLFTFVNELMSQTELAELQLRYFDPTQSFTDQRVNKGLVEALMLKRAQCTVYSVQDSDTLGKDSELAATLAQGKPVITYVPTIDPAKRSQELFTQDPVMIQERLRFLIQADSSFSSALNQQELAFVRNFKVLELYEQDRLWRSLPDPETDAQLRQKYGFEIQQLCRVIAESEKRLYDSRANSLGKHPLAIQVNLETGVANGVLIVRTVKDCATLLRQVLTNSLEFQIEDCQADKMWYLREKITGSVYRVVTQDRKLTNCFWNFYRRK